MTTESPAIRHNDVLEAIYADDLLKVRKLIQQGADLSYRNEVGSNLMIMAIKNYPTNGNGRSGIHAPHFTDILELMLDNGMPATACNDKHGTLLHYAAWRGFTDVSLLLLRHGADIEATDKDGMTPLIQASQRRFPALAAMLISKGARIDAADKDGNTPADYAEKFDCQELKDVFAAAAERKAAEDRRIMTHNRQAALKTRAPKIKLAR